MNKIAITIALLFLTTLPSAQAAERKGYISNEVYLYMLGGPGKKYRIVGRTSAGDSVHILENKSGAKYVKVRTFTGREGWIPKEYLKTGASLKEKLPKLEAQLTAGKEELESERNRYKALKSQFDQLVVDQSTATETIDQLNDQIKLLDQELATRDESNLLRWLTHGGLIAFGGVILGLVIPLFGRRKRTTSDW